MTITAAADGSSLGNPGPAGWAWYVDEDTWDAGGWPQGTNNLGELTAILRLLEATAETGEELHILADSQYAINVVSKWRLGWKKRGWTKADKKPIKNLELIQEIDRAMEGRRVTFEWVKGHAGHRMNERADDLARACAEAYQAGRTPEPGPGFGGGASRGTASANQASGDQPDEGATTVAASVEPHNVPATTDALGSAPASHDASTDKAATSTFRSHPSVFSTPTEANEPAEAAPASSVSEPAMTTEDAIAREREFILAWTGGDEEALAALPQDEDRLRTGLAAAQRASSRLPALELAHERAAARLEAHERLTEVAERLEAAASPAIGRIDAHDLGGAFLTRYRVRWEGGASLESSVWAPATSGGGRLIMVHHQSTLIG